MRVTRAMTAAGGRVDCPLRGSTDVERCGRCPWYATASGRGASFAISCSGQRARDLVAEMAITFPYTELHP